MRRAVLFAVALPALSACDYRARAVAEARHAQMDARIAELDVRLGMLEAENRELRAEIAALQAAATSVPVATDGPTCSGSGSTFTITRAAVDEFFANTSVMASQARIVPSFTDGKPQGFKVFSIHPGSFYATCGLQNGDVVKTVNGYELTSPDKALDAYAKLKGAGRAAIAIERAGKPLVLTITIEG